VTFALVVYIALQGPLEELACSILKPVSLLELSFQLRLTWLHDAALAVMLLGTAGTVAAIVVVVVGSTDVVVVGRTEVVVVVGSTDVVVVGRTEVVVVVGSTEVVVVGRTEVVVVVGSTEVVVGCTEVVVVLPSVFAVAVLEYIIDFL